MTRDEFEDKQYEISVTAGMNQRYHQSRAHKWTWWNRGVQISVAVLAVISLCLAVAAALAETALLDGLAILFSSLAVIAAIALNVLPLGDWVQQHLDLLRRWSDVREDVESLPFDLVDEPTPDLIGRLKALDAKVHRICAIEPGCDEELHKKCYQDEKRSRQSPSTNCAAPAASAPVQA